MAQYRAQVVNAETAAGEVAIEIFRDSEPTPIYLVREPVPENFPAQLKHHLADFLARGYLAACNRFDPSSVWTLYGRPPDPVVQQEGVQAAETKKANPGLNWQKIALRVCHKRQAPSHHCGKLCADRIRQAAKPHMRPQR
jgi:hypothetical protein